MLAFKLSILLLVLLTANALQRVNHQGRTVRKLPVHGNYNFGIRFEWIAGNKDGDLNRIEGRAGWYVDQIKFYLNNGEQSPAHGGNRGDYFNYDVPKG